MCILCQSKFLILVKRPGICLKVLEKSWNKAGQSPGKKKNDLECPGKSWNLDYVFLWQPCFTNQFVLGFILFPRVLARLYSNIYQAYGVISMFGFRRSDRCSNPGRGGELSY